jgi:hypothetical protein
MNCTLYAGLALKRQVTLSWLSVLCTRLTMFQSVMYSVICSDVSILYKPFFHLPACIACCTVEFFLRASL